MVAHDGTSPSGSGEDRGSAAESEPGGSDLIGLELTLVLGVGVIAIIASFFLIGPVAGMVVLLLAVVLAVVGVVAAIRHAEEPPD